MNATEPIVKNSTRILIIGGGFAGLSMGRHLRNQGIENFQLFEADSEVGGLARSFSWHGVDCDIAPHRLYSQDQDVLDDLLSLTEFRVLDRKSRIYLNGRWIRDPVRLLDVLKAYPVRSSVQMVRDACFAKLKQSETGNTFESYVVSTYGRALFEFFFKPYVEKLFGVRADHLSSDWAEQKIRVSGIREMFKGNPRLFFNQFYYPEQGGYGAMVKAMGKGLSGKIHTGHRLLGLEYDAKKACYVSRFSTDQGAEINVESAGVMSSIPLPVLCEMLGHPCSLTYQGMVLLYLSVAKPKVMDDHWVYVMDDEFDINRITEFANFSRDSFRGHTVLCIEITRTESFSVQRIVDQLERLGLLGSEDILDHKVIRLPRAYPLYDVNYKSEVRKAMAFLESFPNLVLAGRQGEFRHQDVDQIYASTRKQIREASWIKGGMDFGYP